MKKITSLFLALAMLLTCIISLASAEAVSEPANVKPRVLITNDGEIDDKNSFVHLLYYANDINLVGLVQTSSFVHWAGSENGPTDDYKVAYAWPGTTWMHEMIDNYAELYDNLLVHDPEYPTPEYLHSIVKIGNVGYTGEMDTATEGSDWVKSLILDDVEGPLYITAWGGMNTISRALNDIYVEYGQTEQWEALRQRIYDKVRIYSWSGQDSIKGVENPNAVWDVCLNYYPDMIYVDVKNCQSTGWNWEKASTAGGTHAIPEVYTGEWMLKNIETAVNGKSKYGSLMDWYITYGDGTYCEGETPRFQFGYDDAQMTSGIFSGTGRDRYDFCGEGDTPTYLVFFDNGLNAFEHPEWGSFSGRFEKDAAKAEEGYTNYYNMVNDTFVMSDWANVGQVTEAASYDSSTRWVTDVMNEFAARVDWGITPNYEDGNHNPSITVLEGNELTAAPGEMLYLNASVSDPDGDDVFVRWFSYPEAGTLGVELNGDGIGYRTSFTVPADALPGDTIHILAKATDDGDHTLSYYQRVIVTVAAK